jgi:hypothetical protein
VGDIKFRNLTFHTNQTENSTILSDCHGEVSFTRSQTTTITRGGDQESSQSTTVSHLQIEETLQKRLIIRDLGIPRFRYIQGS